MFGIRSFVCDIPWSERKRIAVYKIYVIPLYIAWYKHRPKCKGYGWTKERAIHSIVKHERTHKVTPGDVLNAIGISLLP